MDASRWVENKKSGYQVIDRLPYIFTAPPSISFPWILRLDVPGENTFMA